jgi:hypothetical protein
MTILGVMQNMWVRDPEKVKRQLAASAHPEELRRRLIAYALFAGCKSGRVLKAVFGEELCERIIWEEASREIGGHSASVFPPDIPHLRQVIGALPVPSILVLFGEIAQRGVIEAGTGGHYYVCAPHPAARRPDTMDKLRKVYDRLTSWPLMDQ